MLAEEEQTDRTPSAFESVMLHTVGGISIPTVLEDLAFGKPQKTSQTYNFIQKIWNKSRYLQGATGITKSHLVKWYLSGAGQIAAWS